MRGRLLFTSALVLGGLVLILGIEALLLTTSAQAQDPAPQSRAVIQAAVGTAFTYQGQLTDGGNPANGVYDFQFRLYDDASGGSQVGSTVTKNNVTVTDGLFTVQLDFGNVFDGTALWLEVAVRPAGSGSFTALSPRQALTAVPYASYALQNWSLTGNSGTNPTTNFLGTADNQPLVIKTNGVEAVRISESGNVGVGTASPVSKLHVAGKATFQGPDPWIDVRAYGAKGDGTTPDTAAFQAAIDALNASGLKSGTIFVPHGRYVITDSLKIPVTIRGLRITGPAMTDMTPDGTWLIHKSSFPLFTTTGSGGLTFFTLENIAIRQEEDTAGHIFQLNHAASFVTIRNVYFELANPRSSFFTNKNGHGVAHLFMETVRGFMARRAEVPAIDILTDDPRANIFNLSFQNMAVNANAITPTLTTMSRAPIFRIKYEGGQESPIITFRNVTLHTATGGGIHLYSVRKALFEGVLADYPVDSSVPRPIEPTILIAPTTPTARKRPDSITFINSALFAGTPQTPDIRVRGSAVLGPVIINSLVRYIDSTSPPMIIGGIAEPPTATRAVPFYIKDGKILGVRSVISSVQELELWANNQRALRLEPNATSPNVIGGYQGNIVASNRVGVTIGGGGERSGPHIAEGNYSTIGGGVANRTTGDSSTVAGGKANIAAGSHSTVGGGGGNLADGQYATVAGGRENDIQGDYAVIGGGRYNRALAEGATIAGGLYITATAPYATIGGGFNNLAQGQYSTLGGGLNNAVSGDYSTIAGGNDNHVTDNWGTVGGGSYNTASGPNATVGGGGVNTASSDSATVGGGWGNTASGDYATVGGGNSNTASGYASTTGGGSANIAGHEFATVGGGWGNTASGPFATVPGGSEAQADRFGQFAYASGGFEEQAGSAQFSLYVLRAEAQPSLGGEILTPVELFLDGFGERITVPVGSTLVFEILVVGRGEFGKSAGYRITGVIENHEGTTSLIGTPVTVDLGEDDPEWYASVQADDDSDSLIVLASADRESVVRWVAVVRTAEVRW